MARFATIDAGRVTNIIEADAAFAVSIGAIDATGGAIGDLWDGTQFIKPPIVIDPLEYQAKRASEYPPMTDYLDGIVKGDTAQVQTYIDACLAVKAKYPKP